MLDTEATQRTEQGERLQGSRAEAGQAGQEVQVRQGERSGAIEERRQQGLARYGRDPFTMMQRLSDEMDELFDSFFHGRPLARPRWQSPLQSAWIPDVEVCEEGNQVRICADLPGIPKDDVKVDIQEGMLTLRGERREERTEGGEERGFRRSERHYGSFYRSIPLPEGCDAERAQARMNEGVLEITMPFTPSKQARRLEIQG